MKLNPAVRSGLIAIAVLWAVAAVLAGFYWQQNENFAWMILKRVSLLGVMFGLVTGIARALQPTDAGGKPIGKDWASFGALIGMALAGYITELGRTASATMKQIEPGEVLEITGPTLDGQQFSLEQYRGKVTLIDFWATWCGPCVAELPNVKQAYERYHDQGLEIVGVSFDQDRQALAEFVKQEQMPWPQIFFDDEQQQGFANPNGVRYRINAIPCMMLVNKEGRLIARNLRGHDVPSAIAQTLGIAPSLGERLSQLSWQVFNWLALGVMASRWYFLIGAAIVPTLAIAFLQRAITRTNVSRGR